jgi:hypothetical protein
MSDRRRRGGRSRVDRYRGTDYDEDYNDGQGEDDAYRLQQNEVKEREQDELQESGTDDQEDIFRDEDSEDEDDGIDMNLSELLYSTSSFYAIVVPGEKVCVCVYLRETYHGVMLTVLFLQ